MKVNYFIVGLLLFSLTSQSQKVTVTADIARLTDTEVVIGCYTGKTWKLDTIKVKEGKFKWTAEMPEPKKMAIMFSSRYFEFFAESGKIRITGTADSLANLSVTGSKTQVESELFQASIKDISEKASALYEKYGKVSKSEQAELEQQLEQLRSEEISRGEKYISTHPGSAFSISLVADRAMMGQYDEVNNMYSLLNESARGTAQGKLVADRLEVLKRSAIGTAMIEFTQNDTLNKPVQFATFKGKYVLVDFWASWCGPCRAENPNVLNVYNQYKDKGFTVVGVSLDDKEKNWKKAIEDDKMPWTQVSDLKGWKNEVSVYYGILGIPTTFLVDPQGKIIAKNLRGEMLRKKLAELLD